MSIRLQPAHVRTGSKDRESQLVFDDGYLVAVLVQLSDEHGEQAGKWFMEGDYTVRTYGPASLRLTHVNADHR